jgi:hypothetical protein
MMVERILAAAWHPLGERRRLLKSASRFAPRSLRAQSFSCHDISKSYSAMSKINHALFCSFSAIARSNWKTSSKE